MPGIGTYHKKRGGGVEIDKIYNLKDVLAVDVKGFYYESYLANRDY